MFKVEFKLDANEDDFIIIDLQMSRIPQTGEFVCFAETKEIRQKLNSETYKYLSDFEWHIYAIRHNEVGLESEYTTVFCDLKTSLWGM
jgi:hypothetical protein